MSFLKLEAVKPRRSDPGNDNQSVTKRQVAAVAMVTLGITFLGLYYYQTYYKPKKNEKKILIKQHEKNDDQLFEQNNNQQTKNDSNDDNKNNNEDEIENGDYTLHWNDIKDQILSIFEEFIENNVQKDELKILVMDNKSSMLPIHLYKEGFRNITICDLPDIINKMKSKYNEQYPTLTWISYTEDDIKNQKLQQILTASYHLIIHKDISDAFFGSNQPIAMEQEELLYEKLKQFSKLLIEQTIKDENNEETFVAGKYLLMSPRRKISHMKEKQLNWNLRRIIAIGYDVNAKQFASTPFLYFHICTKLNRDNYNVISKQQEERQNAIKQNVFLSNDNNIIINDITIDQTDDKRIITIVNGEFENKDSNDNDKNDKNVMDFSNKSNEIKTKSIQIRPLNLTFSPAIIVENIETDILMRYAKYENNLSVKTGVLFDKIPYYYLIDGVVVSMRKFGKKIVFYDVKLMKDKKQNNENEDDDAVTIQCIAQKSYVNSLNNDKLNQEFKTNYLVQVDDEIKVYGVLGLTERRILSIYVYYLTLMQQ